MPRVMPDFVIKSYSPGFHKIVYLKKFGVSHAGITEFEQMPEKTAHLRKGRFLPSLIRTKSKVLELGYCNDWDYFGTFTLDPDKYDRHNLNQFQKDFSHFLRNESRRLGKINYLLVPERHSKREGEEQAAWHMHGLIKGDIASDLEDFIPGVHPQRLVDKGYKNWPRYAKKFGFCSFAPVLSHDGVCKYLLKYITKDTARSNSEFGAHMYFASQKLQTASITYVYGRCPELEHIASFSTEFADVGDVYADYNDLLEMARGCAVYEKIFEDSWFDHFNPASDCTEFSDLADLYVDNILSDMDVDDEVWEQLVF